MGQNLNSINNNINKTNMAKKTKKVEQVVQSPEEKAKNEFLAQIEEVTSNYDTLLKAIQEQGFDQHGYRPGSKLEVDGEFFILMSRLLPTINTQIQTIAEGIKQTFNNVVTLAEMSSVHLLQINSGLMQAHLDNAKAGRSVHNDELNKDDAPKKIKESTPKIITK